MAEPEAWLDAGAGKAARAIRERRKRGSVWSHKQLIRVDLLYQITQPPAMPVSQTDLEIALKNVLNVSHLVSPIIPRRSVA